MKAAAPYTVARITEKIRENPKTVTLVLDTALRAEPGQFAMIWLPGLDEKPFSIAGDEPLMLTVARVGPFSEALQDLGPGDRLWFRAPFGNGFPLVRGRTLLAGGGYGAAPLHFLARRLLRLESGRGAGDGLPGAGPHGAGGGLPGAAERVRRDAGSGRPAAFPTVALGARASADLLFAERFADLGLDVSLATEDGSAGVKGKITAVVEPLVKDGKIDHLYACGPEGMLGALAALCVAAGVPADLSHEAYMRCGIGICGSCECDGKLVCRDGPVFRMPGASGL